MTPSAGLAPLAALAWQAALAGVFVLGLLLVLAKQWQALERRKELEERLRTRLAAHQFLRLSQRGQVSAFARQPLKVKLLLLGITYEEHVLWRSEVEWGVAGIERRAMAEGEGDPEEEEEDQTSVWQEGERREVCQTEVHLRGVPGRGAIRGMRGALRGM